MMRMGGQIRLVGLNGDPVPINVVSDIVYKEATIKGTTGRIMWKTWHQINRLLATGKFDPRKVVTHRFKLDEYETAFELALSGKAGVCNGTWQRSKVTGMRNKATGFRIPCTLPCLCA